MAGIMRSGGHAKPRVLLVDDHPGILSRVAALLRDDVEIVGMAGDGRQAVQMAPALAPDAIVLDITMPGLDGYQTKSALDQAGCHAPVVFLSMLNSTAHVAEAFRLGGRGYVLKPYLTRDLPAAIQHVLSGRRFVPSLASLFEVASNGGHAMQVYRDPHSFIADLADFFEGALRRGDVTCVIATADIREGLRDSLERRGWIVDGASRHPRFLAIDAAAALDRVMRKGIPDPSQVAEIAAELNHYRLAAGEAARPRLTIFGNMVNVLGSASNVTAALALENAWNKCTHGLPFFTLCGYCTSCFDDAGGVSADACAEHCTVSHAHGF